MFFLRLVSITTLILFLSGCAIPKQYISIPQNNPHAKIVLGAGVSFINIFKDPITCHHSVMAGKGIFNSKKSVLVPANKPFTFTGNMLGATCSVTGTFIPMANRTYYLYMNTEPAKNICFLQIEIEPQFVPIPFIPRNLITKFGWVNSTTQCVDKVSAGLIKLPGEKR